MKRPRLRPSLCSLRYTLFCACVAFVGACAESLPAPPIDGTTDALRPAVDVPDDGAGGGGGGGGANEATGGAAKGEKATGDEKPMGVAKPFDPKLVLPDTPLGAARRAFRGLKQVKKAGNLIYYTKSGGKLATGESLASRTLAFTRTKLTSIAFTLSSAGDCPTLLEELEALFGPADGVGGAGVWAGPKGTLRVGLDGEQCQGELTAGP